MKRLFLAACLASVCTLTFGQNESYFGVNLSGAEFGGVYPGVDGTHYGYPGENDLDYFKEKGLTLIRFPFRWERIQPQIGGELNSTELEKMKRFVSAAEERDMPVILDMHNFARYSFDGGTNYDLIGASTRLTKEHLADVWIKLATEFKDYTNIWGYDMMNEPYAMTTEVPWFDIAQTVIDAIRTVDTETPIIVSGDSYSSSLNWVYFSDNLRNLVDPADNLIFQAHLYFDNDCSGTYDEGYDAEGASAQTGVERARPFVEWLNRYGLRGLIGEYGIPDNDSRWLVTLDNLLSYMKQNGVSGTYWSAGPRWGSYPLSVQPTDNYRTDRPQMQVLEKYPSVGATQYIPASLLVTDFEENDGNAYVAADGTCEWIDNPVKDAINSSDKALKIRSTYYAQVGLPVTLPEGKELTDYYALRFKAMILPGNTGDIDWIGFNVGVSCDPNTMILVDPEQGNGAAWETGYIEQWMNVELHFDETLLSEAVASFDTNERNIMIKLGRAQFVYAIDDVELLEKETTDTPEEQLIFDFEELATGTSPLFEMPWQGSASVVANSYPSEQNNSAQCLQVVNPECSPLTLADALPEGTTWDNYESLSFDICFTEGNAISWAGVEIGVRIDERNGEHVKIGAAYDHSGNETAAWGECAIGNWFHVTLTINPALVTADIAHESKLYIRVMKNDNTYLIDNISLLPIPGAINSVVVPQATRNAIKAWGSNGQVTIRCESDRKIAIYGIDGRMVYCKQCPAGETIVPLGAGIYIVEGTKVVVF